MIGLDTNILVRYLTQDDPIHSPKAGEIVEGRFPPCQTIIIQQLYRSQDEIRC